MRHQAIPRFLATLGVLAGSASPALAEGGEGGGLFSGDLGNAIWTLVIFAAVLVVLGKYAWGPLLDSIQAREAFIRDALQQAKDQREEAEARLAQYTEQIANARNEATAIVDEGRRDAEVVKQRVMEEAREEADQIIARARREIGIARDTAIKDIYRRASSLATIAAGRIIGKELKPEDHERLIEESIADVDKMALN